MRLKSIAVKGLRNFRPAYIAASKLYHLKPGFRSGNPGACAAIDWSIRTAVERNGADFGDYYEFGLYRGYSFWRAQSACAELGATGSRFFGFDSFKGMPAPEGIDGSNREFYRGQFACSKNRVAHYLTEHGVDWSKTFLIEGFYAQTLNEKLRQHYPFSKAGVVFLDCDYYSSTKIALNWIIPYLAHGSLILFDDWYTYGDDPELGQQKACREFLEANPTFELEDLGAFEVNGRSFVLHMT